LNIEESWDLDSAAAADRLDDQLPDELLLQLLDDPARWA
jgi:hypothetical protein